MLCHFLKKKVRLAVLSAILLLSACEEDYVCPIPSVDRFEFNVLMPSHEIMVSNVKAGAQYGYGRHGVIVFRYSNLDGDVFAFDATCADSEACMSAAKGYVKDDGYGHGVCQRCGSTYSLTDGRHSSKKLMLRPYNVQRFATNYYRVSNY